MRIIETQIGRLTMMSARWATRSCLGILAVC
jgi:hypothetical protein